MLVFLKAGGLKGGGVNFDAKLRRNSTDLEDLFIAHIGGALTGFLIMYYWKKNQFNQNRWY